jgi:CxxC motif-containing protein (DUF1111 family)
MSLRPAASSPKFSAVTLRGSGLLGSLLLGSAVLSAAFVAGAESPRAPAPGEPFGGLSSAELRRFDLGRAAFERVHGIESGLGPVFNESACNRCHNKRGVGGGGIQSAVLAGRAEGGAFDALRAQGGPAFAANSVLFEPAADVQRLIPQCKLPRDGEPVPADANVVTRRRTTPLFGLGLVDATADSVFVELSQRQPASIRGRAARVKELASGATRVGKFGWKAQAPSLRQFSGLALLMELGVTSPEFAIEQAPLGDAARVAACDAVPDPEDDGRDVEAMTDFMSLLAPVETLAASPAARAGEAVFRRIGCEGCHVRRLRSGPSPIASLSEHEYAPYSDFLLHDMGSLGDGIAEGDAGPREMRTAPLWGLHLAGGARLLHDGRAKSFDDAILRHEGQGAASRAAFASASEEERRALIAFLETL